MKLKPEAQDEQNVGLVHAVQFDGQVVHVLLLVLAYVPVGQVGIQSPLERKSVRQLLHVVADRQVSHGAMQSTQFTPLEYVLVGHANKHRLL